jgi:hypothetical protein
MNPKSEERAADWIERMKQALAKHQKELREKQQGAEL